MGTTVQGVIFDHSTLLVTNHTLVSQIRSLLGDLKARGLRIGVFSTHPFDLTAKLQTRGFPSVDLFLTKNDVGGVNKGNEAWIKTAAQRWGLKTYELVYVGDEKRDWTTALNTGTFYFHAGWCNPFLPSGVTTAFYAGTPGSMYEFLSHILLLPPRWTYTLDLPQDGFYVRCLVDANVNLPATSRRSFTPKDIFTYQNDVRVGKYNARDWLVLHAFGSLYLEGFLDGKPGLAVYPSSTPGQTNAVLTDYIDPVSKTFRVHVREDLLVRAVAARDTSRERSQKNYHNVTFAEQTNTVHLNPKHRVFIRNRPSGTIIVFDDFTTSGMSLDWARNLLQAAGAKRVILVTVGKYRLHHSVYRPQPHTTITPFERRTYDPQRDFTETPHRMVHHPQNQDLIIKSFQHLVAGDPLP